MGEQKEEKRDMSSNHHPERWNTPMPQKQSETPFHPKVERCWFQEE